MLFLPTALPGVWTIFNVSFPNYFLDISSHPAFEAKTRQDCILASITIIKCFTVDEFDSNPYRLSKGSVYYQCSAEPY